MKTLKLEVGKTYRSREGKDVKIVKKDGSNVFPYFGEDGSYYREDGRFWYHKHPVDLIEEVPSETTRHTFAIPDGVKQVTVEQVGNRIVVEMVPEDVEPKPGDVMRNDWGCVYILKSVRDDGKGHNYFVSLGANGHLFINTSCFPGRPATPEEAQPLWDALKKAGKRWNTEAMEVEDVSERERIMDFLKGYVNHATWNYEQLCWMIERYLKHREGKNETNR